MAPSARWWGFVTLLALVLGCILGNRFVEDRVTASTTESAASTADIAAYEFLTHDDLVRGFDTLTHARLEALDRSLGARLRHDGVVLGTVRNRQHWVVYSTEPALVGNWSPGSDALERAFAGEITVDVIEGTEASSVAASMDSTLRIITPIRADLPGGASSGAVVGALETHVSYAPIAAKIRETNQRAAVGVGVIALMILLVGVQRHKRRVPHARVPLMSITLDGGSLRFAELSQSSAHVRPVENDAAHIDDVGVLLLGEVGYTGRDHVHHSKEVDAGPHHAGAQIAEVLHAGDLVAHMGGNEVAILLRSVARSEVGAVVEDLVATLDQRDESAEAVLDLRAPFGVVVLEQGNGGCGQFLRDAEVVFEGSERRGAGRSSQSDVQELV